MTVTPYNGTHLRRRHPIFCPTRQSLLLFGQSLAEHPSPGTPYGRNHPPSPPKTSHRIFCTNSRSVVLNRSADAQQYQVTMRCFFLLLSSICRTQSPASGGLRGEF
ncbi:hypothetical protein I7I50_06925 [Histoplasma capsulatum G186AR]|uniref:Uncharacterized protein n=1 Tax=Ajellomyces capsulatus TaxID=5037 RepID=A0A8H7Z1S1_AJECA|nr:hypothetical protein I7I52_10001 [Histoplasma capsulatum]QSS67749.1 hypothetical protein I7I50_06925 [Histoplasma capsulatum G186AR]